MSAIGDRLALWLMPVTVRRLTAGELARRRAEAASAPGRLLDLLDAEIRRRAEQADFWGSP